MVTIEATTRPEQAAEIVNDSRARRIVCPEHGFRIGDIKEENREGDAVSFILQCPRCNFTETLDLSG